MCSPGLAIAAVSTGLQVVSGLAQASAQRQGGDLQAEAIEQQIDANEKALGLREENERIRRRKQIAAARAASGASGRDPNLGSTLDVLGDITRISAFQIFDDRFQTRAQNNSLAFQADLSRFQGRTAATNTILSTAANVFSNIPIPASGVSSGASGAATTGTTVLRRETTSKPGGIGGV